MESKKAVDVCSTCPLCKFTRSRKKPSILYSLARLIQKVCPDCRAANAALGKDYQKMIFP